MSSIYILAEFQHLKGSNRALLCETSLPICVLSPLPPLITMRFCVGCGISMLFASSRPASLPCLQPRRAWCYSFWLLQTIWEKWSTVLGGTLKGSCVRNAEVTLWHYLLLPACWVLGRQGSEDQCHFQMGNGRMQTVSSDCILPVIVIRKKISFSD